VPSVSNLVVTDQCRYHYHPDGIVTYPLPESLADSSRRQLRKTLLTTLHNLRQRYYRRCKYCNDIDPKWRLNTKCLPFRPKTLQNFYSQGQGPLLSAKIARTSKPNFNDCLSCKALLCTAFKLEPELDISFKAIIYMELSHVQDAFLVVHRFYTLDRLQVVAFSLYDGTGRSFEQSCVYKNADIHGFQLGIESILASRIWDVMIFQ
jgi:hypothetical protein